MQLEDAEKAFEAIDSVPIEVTLGRVLLQHEVVIARGVPHPGYLRGAGMIGLRENGNGPWVVHRMILWPLVRIDVAEVSICMDLDRFLA